jgi:ABC-type glutathione transport system ATPase component
MSMSLLTLNGVTKRYPFSGGWSSLLPGHRQWQTVLAPTDLTIAEGDSVGLVGESGSGKTTLARIAAGLTPPSSGELCWQGQPIDRFGGKQWARWRREVQYVFQNPASALNPRHRVRRILDGTLAGLTASDPKPPDRKRRAQRIAETADRVGLGRGLLERFPHQLSGGQAQRVAIARALLGAPRLVILDEPVSALDVSLQAQILNLLTELRAELGLTYLFISHDLAVVERLCERVHVMREGKIVEQGPTEAILGEPRCPYTRALVEAVPRLP